MVTIQDNAVFYKAVSKMIQKNIDSITRNLEESPLVYNIEVNQQDKVLQFTAANYKMAISQWKIIALTKRDSLMTTYNASLTMKYFTKMKPYPIFRTKSVKQLTSILGLLYMFSHFWQAHDFNNGLSLAIQSSQLVHNIHSFVGKN